MKKQDDLGRGMAVAADAVLGAAVLTGAGAYAGFWADRQLNTSPWLSISLPVLGMCLGLARMVRKAIDLDKPDDLK